MMPNPEIQRARILELIQGLRQEDAARRLGISQQSVSRILREGLNVKMAIRIAQKLHINPLWIYGLDSNKNRRPQQVEIARAMREEWLERRWKLKEIMSRGGSAITLPVYGEADAVRIVNGAKAEAEPRPNIERRSLSLPVHGYCGGGISDVDWHPCETGEEVEISGIGAIVVRGESMAPLALDGQAVVYDIGDVPDNGLAVIEIRCNDPSETRLLFKRVRRLKLKDVMTGLELSSVNWALNSDGSMMFPPLRVPIDRVVNLYRVTAILPRNLATPRAR